MIRSNEDLRNLIENKGFRITSNMGWEDGEQVIVSYTAHLGNGRTTGYNTAPNLYELAENLGLI